ncbi:MAG: hypothetical protein AAF322_01700 [Pseudomonadota bacterium]
MDEEKIEPFEFKTPWLGKQIARAFLTLGLVSPPSEAEDEPEPRYLPWIRGFAKLLLPVWFGLLVLVLYALGTLAIAFPDVATSTDKRWQVLAIAAMIAALGGLVGAPLALIRVHVAERQTKTAEAQQAIAAEVLFNQRFNTANDGLSARRQVTRPTIASEEEKILTEWEDDLVARNTAIEALESLANENPDAAVRIARILSVYVREMSRE